MPRLRIVPRLLQTVSATLLGICFAAKISFVSAAEGQASPKQAQIAAEPPIDNSPAAALGRLKVADGLNVELFASEPLVRKPLTMSFDERGRMWVIQYLQYPAPTGLKQVDVDEFRRVKYERLPDPPPHGPRGADKVTILEDSDGDGRPDRAKDFVTGLNLATGLVLGQGGVWVVQPPYLLFYGDTNRDDVPDGDPRVVLTGFGLNDAHATANSLQWGPDGWLYGAQGSTVTANIRGIEFQQGIWRYHPPTDRFELFAEGGGNTYGLDFDQFGNAIAGTNFGNYVALHHLQGAYYLKSFGKHGALHNPFAFGYFQHLPHEGWRGGHVTSGGIIYQAKALPERFHHKYIAANVLANAIHWHDLTPDRSSFRTKFAGELVRSPDSGFRPIDITVGPDGALYVADWADEYIQYQAPAERLDRTRGRIWRIAPANHKIELVKDLVKRPTDELLTLLAHDNAWYRQQARRLLDERRDPATIPALKLALHAAATQSEQLELLWALHGCGGLDDSESAALLKSPHEYVRAWAVRLIGDRAEASPRLAGPLAKLAAADTSAVVRAQLACTAKRMPAEQAMPIIRALLAHEVDRADAQIPLLIWWAVEQHLSHEPDAVLPLFADAAFWKLPLVQSAIVERTARRCTAMGERRGYDFCASLLRHAPDDANRRLVITGMDAQLAGKPLPRLPSALAAEFEKIWATPLAADAAFLRLGVKLGDQRALTAMTRLAFDETTAAAERVGYYDLLARTGQPEILERLLPLIAAEKPESPASNSKQRAASETLTKGAMLAAGQFDDQRVADTILKNFARYSPAIRVTAVQILVGRPERARRLAAAVDSGLLSPREVTLDQIRQLVAYQDAPLTKLVEKHWGRVQSQTAGEKQERVRTLMLLVRAAGGTVEEGKAVFTKTCAACHQLHGQGTNLGPDLTGAERRNVEMLLTNIVDPSGYIRPEFMAHTALLADGRVFTGLLAESTPDRITLVNAKNMRVTVPMAEIEELKPLSQSLMPEKLLDTLSPHELRCLFRYLQSELPR